MAAETPFSGKKNKALTSLLPMLLVIAIGFLLRVWHIDTQPVRGDEGFSLVIWTKHFGDMFGELATTDPQPPLTLLWFFGWTKALGATAFGGRIPSAMASTLTIAVVYAIGKMLNGKRTATLAALLTAFNPFAIWFAQDVRSGAFWTCVSGLGVFFMLRTVKKPEKISHWAAYILLSIAGLYTFYLEAFILIFQNIFMGIHALKKKQFPLRWAIAQLIILTAIAPWYLQPSLRQGEYSPTAGAVNITWPFHSFLFGNTMPTPLQIGTPEYNAASPLAFIGIALVIGALILIWKDAKNRDHALFVSLYMAIPFLLLACMEWITGDGYFRVRYFFSSSIGWMIALGWGLDRLASFRISGQRRYSVAVAYTLLAGILALNLIGFGHYRSDPQFIKAPDLKGLADDLRAVIGEDDAIVYNGVDPTFELYYPDMTHVVILPDPEVDLAEEIGRLEETYDSLYFVPWPDGGWDDEQVVAAYLREHMLLTTSYNAFTYQFERYDSFTASASEIENPLHASFDETIVLKGYELVGLFQDGEIHPGESVNVIVYWESLKQPMTDLKVFVHLIGTPGPDGSPLRAQDDHLPQYGRLSTTTWEADVLYRDVYTLQLPADLPPGEYSICVGFYDPVTGIRLSQIVSDLPMPFEGAVQLAAITVQ